LLALAVHSISLLDSHLKEMNLSWLTGTNHMDSKYLLVTRYELRTTVFHSVLYKMLYKVRLPLAVTHLAPLCAS